MSPKVYKFLQDVEMVGKIVLLGVMTALCVRVMIVTLPKVDAEVDESHRFSVEAGLTAMSVRKLTAVELQDIPQTEGKINAALDRANALLESSKVAIDQLTVSQTEVSAHAVTTLDALTANINQIKPVLVSSQQAIEGLKPVENAATRVITSSQGAADAVTKAVSDPALHNSLQNMQTATGNFADMSTDAKGWFHSWLHPTWPHKIKSFFENQWLNVTKAIL